MNIIKLPLQQGSFKRSKSMNKSSGPQGMNINNMDPC